MTLEYTSLRELLGNINILSMKADSGSLKLESLQNGYISIWYTKAYLNTYLIIILMKQTLAVWTEANKRK